MPGSRPSCWSICCSLLREALTNVEKHARGTRVVVTVSVDETSCVLRVQDDGVGLGPASASPRGFGLVNLRRRAEKLGGSLTIESGVSGDRAHLACTSSPRGLTEHQEDQSPCRPSRARVTMG